MAAKRAIAALAALGGFSAASASEECAGAWQQCGGEMSDGRAYPGPNCCTFGFTCMEDNKYYSQCRPVNPHKAVAAATNLQAGEDCASAWQQCGGSLQDGRPFSGPSCCAFGFTCTKDSEWYSQCKPVNPHRVQPASNGLQASQVDGQDCASAWQQCGGSLQDGRPFSGPSCCIFGFSCVKDSDYYSQCKPVNPHRVAPANSTALSASPDPEKAPHPAVNPIVVKGKFLYDAVTQKRFFVKGLDYNPNPKPYSGGSSECKAGTPKLGPYNWGTDLVTDELEELWREDLQVIADLGVNTIRLYDVDPEASHAKFMEATAKLGIYVIVPLTRAKWGFLPSGFAAPECYNTTIEGYGNVGTNLLVSAKLIVKQFSKYDNTLMFAVGNEVETTHRNGYAALPCVKALTRDIHAFQDTCVSSMRRVPLIYSATDVGGRNRKLIAQYLTCEQDTKDQVADAVDVYGLNVYSWCDMNYTDERGQLSFKHSPYNEVHRDFLPLQAPLVFTEFDCKVGAFNNACPYKGGRTWPQVKVMVQEMADVLSGALAYEYSMEENEFGLVLKAGYLEDQDTLVKTDSYFALQKAYTSNHLPDKWDGHWTDATRCSWTPPRIVTTPEQVTVSTCDPTTALAELLEQVYSGSVTAGPVDFTPPGTSMECPNYAQSSVAYKEGCCHSGCSSLEMDLDEILNEKAVRALPVVEEQDAVQEPVVQLPHAPTSWALVLVQIAKFEPAKLKTDQLAALRSLYAKDLANLTGNPEAFITDLEGTPKQVTLLPTKVAMIKALVGLMPGTSVDRVRELMESERSVDLLLRSTRDLLQESLAITGQLAVRQVAVTDSGAVLRALPVDAPDQASDILEVANDRGSLPEWVWFGLPASVVLLTAFVGGVVWLVKPKLSLTKPRRTRAAVLGDTEQALEAETEGRVLLSAGEPSSQVAEWPAPSEYFEAILSQVGRYMPVPRLDAPGIAGPLMRSM